MAVVKYLNLTNGLEYINEVGEYKLVRIQSSICESKNWNRLIHDLDYNFLFDLAQGNEVEIYDRSSRKIESRAVYQGVPFICYVLRRRWFGRDKQKVFVKMNDVTSYFANEYEKLDNVAKKKIDYVKKFLNTDEIHVKTFSRQTEHDGDYEFYKKIVKENTNVKD